MRREDRAEIVRAVPLLDMEVGADGRTVTALAATFGDPYAVRDFDGDYDEVINRAAFNRTLSHGFKGRVQPLFNHGMTVHQTPSEKWSSPLGVPLDIRAEPRGLLTVTRYSKLPHAEEALTMIIDGAITAQSFRGPIIRSTRGRLSAGGRPMIERMELGLRDYGPAPFAANVGAQILAVRSQVITEHLDALGDLSEEERAELARMLLAHGTAEEAPADTTETTPLAEEAPDPATDDLLELAAAQRRRRL
jgi:HK97 family phage prohead protease